jgi:wobble nucleotide-excising tRNase
VQELAEARQLLQASNKKCTQLEVDLQNAHRKIARLEADAHGI